MTDAERWARVDQLLDAALDRPLDERSTWLEEACRGDRALRDEVEKLLDLAHQEDDPLEPSGAMRGPLWQEVVADLERDRDTETLAPGDRVGSYRILGLIGSGGMGTVYRARDPNLDRDVALKALSAAFQDDPAFLRRFEREAKLLASLNHPNVGAIYDLLLVEEKPYLVLELVEGRTLADRLRRGPLKVDEALAVARQVAEALEEAHRKGIVHRDLKPGNVKLTSDGRVKVLDFGLAKSDAAAAERDAARGESGGPSTTRSGMVLGTAAYMSPEQARGLEVDKRTDIWAFGCLLYEMLTGERLFRGATSSDTLAAVLRDEIDWSRLPTGTPPALRRLMRRCLHRDLRERLQDIGDARIEIAELGEAAGEDFAEAGRLAHRPWLVAVLAGVAVASTVIAAWQFVSLRSRAAPGPAAVTRTTITVGPEERLWVGISSSIALSPEGSHLAFVAGSGGQSRLYLRELGSYALSEVPGSDGARNPFFSPDGRWIAFFARGQIQKAPVTGGNPVPVAEVGLQPRGASWGDDEEIVFSEAGGAGLYSVPAGGGAARLISETHAQDGGVEHLWPHHLPGGEAILFTLQMEDESGTKEKLAVLSRKTGEIRELREGGQGVYLPPGYLVFVHRGTLEAVAFDRRRLTISPSGVTALDEVNTYPRGAASFSLSRSGTLVYLSPREGTVSLDRVDRTGRVAAIEPPRGTPAWPRIAPDGRRLAIHVGVPGSRDIWILDLERPGSMRQLTFAGGEFPVWSPDGERVAFARRRQRTSSVYTVAADGSKEPELLFESDATKVPLSWSVDGVLAYYQISGDTQRDIWVADVQEGAEPRAFVATGANELSPVFSPDGRWLAYVSDETGRNEVYVRPYPPPGAVTAVSIDGGSEPLWSRDGSELFYRHGNAIMAVAVESGPSFRAGEPREVFRSDLVPNSAGNPSYDVTPDGQTFVMVRTPPGASVDRLRLVLNWPEELRRRVTSGR